MGIRGIVLLGSLAVLSPCSMFAQATPAVVPPTGSNAEGKAAIERLTQAFGGSAKVNAVKTMSQTVTATGQGQDKDRTAYCLSRQAGSNHYHAAGGGA